jgi:hypothetical protein
MEWLRKVEDEDNISESDLGSERTSSTTSSSRSSGSSQFASGASRGALSTPTATSLTFQNLSALNEGSQGTGFGGLGVQTERSSTPDPRRKSLSPAEQFATY